MEGEPHRSQQEDNVSLGRVDMRALDQYFSMGGLPGPSYQCEVRTGRNLPGLEPNSEGTAGTSNASHDLLELGDGAARHVLQGQAPIYVEGIGWVIPLGPSSVGNSSGIRDGVPTEHLCQDFGWAVRNQ